MLTFLLSFILLSLVTAVFIISFYHLSRHWVIIEPDGRRNVGGDILKWWSWFWERSKGVKKIYYKNEGFDKKMEDMRGIHPEVYASLVIGLPLPYLFSFLALPPDNKLKEVEMTLMCKIGQGNVGYYLYAEVQNYIFPEWVRKPMSQCYVCMSSVFGSAAWWIFVYLQKDMFVWSKYPEETFFLLWIVFIVFLSGINRFLGAKSFQYV